MKKLSLLLFLLSANFTFGQIVTDLKADFERSKSQLILYLDTMPEDKLEEIPAEGSRSFKQQILHTVQGTVGLVSNASNGTPPFPKGNMEQTMSNLDNEELLDLVTKAFEYADSELKKLKELDLDQIVVKGPFKILRMSWARKGFEHMVHHKG